MLSHILDRDDTGIAMEVIPAPAPGADFAWTVPEYTNILPISIDLTITTAVGGASRHLHIAGRRGGQLFCHSSSPAVQLANSTTEYNFALCVLGVDDQGTNEFQTAPLSQALVLSWGEELVSHLHGIQAGDQISAIYLRYLQKMPR